MATPTLVLNVVGLTTELLDAAPRLRAFRDAGRLQHLVPVLPAVTCSVQSTMLTGAPVSTHGVVGNGWYDRDQCEVQFWKQSNRLVRAEKVWETARARDASTTCANLFWWYNMYSSVDVSVTPRPIYKADGRKIPDVHTHPPELRDALQAELGRFPLFDFWGPRASIPSTRWIAAAARAVIARHDPTLTLAYLPHLDYALQRFGPGTPEVDRAVGEIDAVVGDLLDHAAAHGRRVIVLSEYGIEPVHAAVDVNRGLRRDGGLRVREEEGLELLDAGASDAFAVADHQAAHVYVARDRDVPRIAARLAELDGVETVLDRAAQRERGIDHPRAGELLAVAESGRWFTHDYWLDDDRAPDFARTVDIHRKPGYDPRELFMDPALSLPTARVAWKLLRKKLGFRQLMDVIPLDASLVRGSHGRVEMPEARQPVLITDGSVETPDDAELPCAAVRDVILAHLLGPS
jgi:predicted AlkP superfamily pyrophosphatase or phosphodiesterase